ncbi:MAG: cysteine desulfurase [Gemmatimonadota bacterium]|nr:cysteine desulfurase [Gemmatimonadota bacterium]
MQDTSAIRPFVYLDAAATTPVRPEVRAAMDPFLSDELFGNPSSTHWAGRMARQALDGARRRIGEALDADPSGVVFTSGGTEADNLAILGSAVRPGAGAGRAAIPATEHKAVLDAARELERLGGEALDLPVHSDGTVDLAAVGNALEREPAVLSVMWVNNETGVVQPVERLAEMARDAGVPFHTDGVQAVGKVPCSLDRGSISMLSISGHKIGAPKGIGALILRQEVSVAPRLHGGGQQRGVRPGTENVAGAIGLATAVELAIAERGAFGRDVTRLREELERRVLAAVPDSQVVGASATRAPHVSNIAFAHAAAGTLLAALDLGGIACSAGSACASGSPAASHVLTAMRVPNDFLGGAVRFSLSLRSSMEDVDRLLAVLPEAVDRARTARGAA